jgi:surfactin family lipopeptide synthetase A
MKVALFHLTEELQNSAKGDRLLIVIHHMVVDGVSWRILLEDLRTLIAQYRLSEELVLPMKTDSFKKWSESLAAYAKSEKLQKEKAYWEKVCGGQTYKLPLDNTGGSYSFSEYNTCSFQLSAQETEMLITKVNFPFNTQINDILLSGLALALNDAFNVQQTLIDLEGHGRENIIPELDVSRTVGWFTSAYPVLLETGDAAALGDHIVRIKEALRSVPDNGIDYGILKYLSGNDATALVNDAQVSFNYLGQFDQDVNDNESRIAPEDAGQSHSQAGECKYELNVSGMIAGGRLSMNINYNKHHFTQANIDRLADAYKQRLAGIIDFCLNVRQRAITSSDLSVKGVSKASIDKISSLFNKK